MNQNIDRINYYNILAMFAASCLAYIYAFELVLLSYAILGARRITLLKYHGLKAGNYFIL